MPRMALALTAVAYSSWEWVGRCCCNHPHMPPVGRRERALVVCADAWPPRPAGGAAKPQPVRHYSDPNRIQGIQETAFGYAHNVLALSRSSASGAQAQTAENSHQ